MRDKLSLKTQLKRIHNQLRMKKSSLIKISLYMTKIAHSFFYLQCKRNLFYTTIYTKQIFFQLPA